MKKTLLFLVTFFMCNAVWAADSKVSDLSETTDIQGSDEFYLNDGGSSAKITATNVFDIIDTEAELESISNITNIIRESEIDASNELSAIVDDETGTGALMFGTSPLISTGLGIVESPPSNIELYVAGEAGVSSNLTVGGTVTLSNDLTVAGTTHFNGVDYNWPAADGSDDQRLTTNGDGGLTWETVSGGAGEWTDEGSYLRPTDGDEYVACSDTGTPDYVDGDGDLYVEDELEIDGVAVFGSDVTVSGTLYGSHVMQFSPQSAKLLHLSNPAEIDSLSDVFKLDFDDSTDESGTWQGLWNAYDGEDIFLDIKFAMTSAITGVVEYVLYYTPESAGANLDIDDGTFWESQTSAQKAVPSVLGSTAMLSLDITASGTSTATDDWFKFRLERNTSVTGNASGDCEVVGMKMRSAR